MSKLACIEAVYDVLRAAGLDSDGELFEDILNGCAAVAMGEGGFAEPLAWIAAGSGRTAAEVGYGLILYAHRCGCVRGISGILADAAEAGRRML